MLHASTSNILQADESRLYSRNKVIVLLTFANNETFQFEMLVIPDLKGDIIFGNNHLSKTDAAINCQGLAISFKDPSMNFELSCICPEQSYNMLQAFTTTLNLGLCRKKRTSLSFRFFFGEGRTDCSRIVGLIMCSVIYV